MRVWRVAKDRLLNDKAGESGWLIGVDSSVVDAIVASHTSQKHQKQFYSLENPLDILPEGFKVIGIYRSASNSHAEADGISSSITSTSSRAMDTSSTRNSEQVMCVIDREEKSLGFFLDGKAIDYTEETKCPLNNYIGIRTCVTRRIKSTSFNSEINKYAAEFAHSEFMYIVDHNQQKVLQQGEDNEEGEEEEGILLSSEENWKSFLVKMKAMTPITATNALGRGGFGDARGDVLRLVGVELATVNSAARTCSAHRNDEPHAAAESSAGSTKAAAPTLSLVNDDGIVYSDDIKTAESLLLLPAAQTICIQVDSVAIVNITESTFKEAMQLLISKVQSQLSKIKQRWDNDYSASHTTSKYAVACTTALSSAKTQAASLSSSSSSSSYLHR
mmetsp:Transcript_12398/g.20561  ORF Transcript_12398/g.20561 Transcript_12398/m.20561 type:complete len:389 (-) Transcript_12398:2202-3368(-)